jgi:hypothetical protein
LERPTHTQTLSLVRERAQNKDADFKHAAGLKPMPLYLLSHHLVGEAIFFFLSHSAL